MQAIRKIIHDSKDWERVKKSLPESFLNKKLEIIIIPAYESGYEEFTIDSPSSLRGALNEYANPEMMKEEEGAWKESVRDEK